MAFRHLGFLKYNFSTSGTVWTPAVHHGTKFYCNIFNSCRNMTFIFLSILVEDAYSAPFLRGFWGFDQIHLYCQ